MCDSSRIARLGPHRGLSYLKRGHSVGRRSSQDHYRESQERRNDRRQCCFDLVCATFPKKTRSNDLVGVWHCLLTTMQLGHLKHLAPRTRASHRLAARCRRTDSMKPHGIVICFERPGRSLATRHSSQSILRPQPSMRPRHHRIRASATAS